MRILLDTHIFLWMQTAPERLGADSLRLLEDGENDLYLSAASSWEISIKHALGRLALPLPPGEYVPSRMQTSGVLGLAIEHSHALGVADLPRHHSDPFDRLLVAQAQLEKMPILTVDPQLSLYEVEILGA